MRESRKVLPKQIKTNHINKQSMYGSFIKNGSGKEAEDTFKRPPFYMTMNVKNKEEMEED